MSWLYLPAQVAEYSEAGCSDGGQSVMSSKIPTASLSLNSESETERSTTPRSGTTLPHSTGVPGLDAWISSLAASPVSPGLSQISEPKGLKTNAISGLIPFASLAKSDQDGFFWKMSQGCLPGLISDEYSQTWPSAGAMLAGIAYRLPMLVPRTSDTGSGFWATPTSRDWRSGKASQKTMGRNSRPLSEQVGGHLNPDWVEWLMGYPIGWSALEPLEMDRFRQWLELHGSI